ncbi:MAG TPA: cytochrome P450 [Acetobacteraceae bacterium]|jgi:cytochrome P450|nr:cytochrome P450 [Acetobacteraceae bacterium]
MLNRVRIQDDMFTPDVIADPYAYYGRLRDEDPVHWNETYALWVITRHDDLVWLTRHHEMFSSAVFKNDPRPPYPDIDESDLGLYDYVRNYQGDQFIQHDRPQHLEMRRVMHSYFTPKQMEAWRPFVVAAVKELLDAAEAKGEMDVMRDLATPLPVLVIAQMMGVPPEERGYVRQLAEKLLYIGRGDYDRMKPLTEGMRGMIEYVSPLVDKRIVDPGDDFISVLARGEKQGVFTRHQVLVNTSLLLLAGHETTINLLCNGTLALLNHPDQWDLLKQDPAGRMKATTEECLRYDAPVKSIQRIASEDVEMRGKLLRKDDRVRWFISSANRDPDAFAEPEVFDIARHPNQHVAFGSGVHHCLGATLARVEGQEVFKALAERFPGLRVTTDTLEYQPSITFRSLKSLPVTWH